MKKTFKDVGIISLIIMSVIILYTILYIGPFLNTYSIDQKIEYMKLEETVMIKTEIKRKLIHFPVYTIENYVWGDDVFNIQFIDSIKREDYNSAKEFIINLEKIDKHNETRKKENL